MTNLLEIRLTAGEEPSFQVWGGNDKTTFGRNKRGHVTFAVTGLDLTGSQEIEHLESGGFYVADYVKPCLMGIGPDSYDVKHRLVKGQQYTVVLMPGDEIALAAQRVTKNLLLQGTTWGYEKPPAGIVPRIREVISSENIRAMGFQAIIGLHDPIMDPGGDLNLLAIGLYGSGRWLEATMEGPKYNFLENTAFAFLVPARST